VAKVGSAVVLGREDTEDERDRGIEQAL